jgi:hypothetical protein
MMPELQAIINPRAVNTPACTRGPERRGGGRANSLLAGKIFRRSDDEPHQHIRITQILDHFPDHGQGIFAQGAGNFLRRAGIFLRRAGNFV